MKQAPRRSVSTPDDERDCVSCGREVELVDGEVHHVDRMRDAHTPIASRALTHDSRILTEHVPRTVRHP